MAPRTECDRVFVIWVYFLLSGLVQISMGDEDGDKQLSNIKRLKDDLFKNYDSHVRPVVHHSNSTNVAIQIEPYYIIDLREDTSLLIMDLLLSLTWTDERLVWKPEDYEGLTRLNLPDHYVWQPDIVVYNSYSWNMDPKGNSPLILYNYGEVWYFPPAVMTTYCPLTPVSGSYPRETIECHVIMGSWSHDGWQINLTLLDTWGDNGMYLGDFTNTNPRWELLPDQVNFIQEVKYFNCCHEPYITLNAKFPLQRRYPPELKVIWAPCILVMTLTLIMFWIPPDSGKKIILGSFLFFALISLVIFVGHETKSQRSMMLAVAFLQSTLYAVVSALVLETVVMNLSCLVGPGRPPDLLVELLSGPLGRATAVFARWMSKVPGDKIQLKEDAEIVVYRPRPNDEWILVATAMDRVLFLLYIIVFAAIRQA